MTEQIRLTTFAVESGSAARLGPCDLQAVPDALPGGSPESRRMLETCDYVAVTCVSDGLCLVETVGLFTAIVDTPYWSVGASLVGRLMARVGA
jgi:selenophosphate synthase